MHQKIPQKRKDSVLHCLMTGKLRIKVGSRYYYLIQPDQQTRVLAAIQYEDCLYQLRFEPWLTTKSMTELLVSRGIITSTLEQHLFSLHKRTEDLKVDLYRSMFSTANDKKIRHELDLVREQIRELEASKNSLYYLTLEGYAVRQKLLVLLAGSLFYEISNIKVYQSFEDVDCSLLDSIANQKHQNEPTDTEIREIARTNPWRGLWSLDKNPLDKNILELTEYQQALYMYSHLYDSIRESIDCPPDNIIEDDDVCDGWLIMQSRKAERDKKEKQVEDVVGKGKAGGAQEVFIPAKSPQDIQAIQSMNDMGTKITLAQRKKQIEAQGEVKETQLKDNRIKMMGMVIEAQKGVKNKK
jgi:hypothetical protein